MSLPAPLDDFSHLPTVDERDAAGAASAQLWERTRPAERRTQVTGQPEPEAPPELEPEPEAGYQNGAEAPAPEVDPEQWRSLLELDPEAPPAFAPVLSAAPPRVRSRTVVRPASRPQPEVEQKEEPTPRGEPEGPMRTPEDREPAAEPPPHSESEPVSPAHAKMPPEMPAEKPAADPGADGAGEKESASAKDGGEAKKRSLPGIEGKEKPPSRWQRHWQKVGGGALGLSLGVHLLLLAGAGVYVVNRALEPRVDFLPGGGTVQGQAAAQELQHQIQQKKNPWLKQAMPMRRLVSTSSVSEMVLPEQAPDLLDLPSASDALLKGRVGGGMGLAGAGGGFGAGMGLGSRGGSVFQPLSMFGREIKAKKMALVLDVSGSMAPHLPRVIAEVDRVARDSVVVLFVGCGLEAPYKDRPLTGQQVFRTSGPEFEKFWRMGGATLEAARKFRFSAKDPIPSEDVFRMLARRPQTYFIHEVGLSYTWLALLSNEVRSADALYWFSDFQDQVSFQQVGIVRENLMNRKQKLYIHAYQRGSAFDLVVNQLVKPTGGDVIEEQ